MINKILGNKVTNFFTILGAIATMVGVYITYYAISAGSEEFSSKGVSRLQEAAAKFVAPSGFTVKPALISKVPDNTDFSSVVNKPILVTRNEIPFMISSGTERNLEIKVNGSLWRMRLGDKRQFSGSKCSIWLYAIKDETYSFKMMECG